jgi:uncharacterized membrane protein HdeD (DUF308 family)
MHALATAWWLILLRGVLAVVFGVLTFVWPGITLLTLVIVYGAYAFVDGAAALWAAIAGGQVVSRWWLAVVGIAGVGAGVAALLLPGVTALVLLYFIAGWAIAVGVMQVIGGIVLRRDIDNEWALIAAGVLSIAVGAFMILAPGAGALALLFVIGAYAVMHGVLLILLAFRLRGRVRGIAGKLAA